ncbi:MAG: hypothetical protein K0Q76_3720 [Panacagrimonas sp.]|jgi:hypothetical protein|nr:hypothetical protein [Panacagrimonas sp.]MCC2658612.1 hypothetical protein [Panacagrimonas sp.]
MNNDQLQQTLGGPVVFGTPRRMGIRGRFWKSAEAHLWCADCTRTFPNGVARLVESRPACPYADCESFIGTRAYLWSEVRARHPLYPQHPNMAVQYACPPWSKPYQYPGSVRQGA